MKELKLIELISKKVIYDSTVIKGIGDDCAVLEYNENKNLLFACDMIVDRVHFDVRKHTPFQIGWKAIAVNISDIAAMAGHPRYVAVAIGMPVKTTTKFVKGLYKGMTALAKKFDLNIVGGDIVRADRLSISISIIGDVDKKYLVTRIGAKEKDAIFVTGRLGGSYKNDKHVKFCPRVKEARFLSSNFKITSMIDLSDGLALDLYRIISLNKKGAVVYKELIPLSKSSNFKNALYDGEDFELLFTVEPESEKKLIQQQKIVGTGIARIGHITDIKFGYKYADANGNLNNIDIEKAFAHF